MCFASYCDKRLIFYTLIKRYQHHRITQFYSSFFTYVVSADARTSGIPMQRIITFVAILKINILF
jgi:hypothetical protein